jgi:hypothetical protein
LLELFSAHSVIYALAGVAFLGGAIVPRLVGHLPASPPMMFLGLGLLVFSLPLGLGTVDPIEHSEITEYLTEIGVIVSLMGAGLKLDRPLGLEDLAAHRPAARHHDAGDHPAHVPGRLVGRRPRAGHRPAARRGAGADRPGAGGRGAGGTARRRAGRGGRPALLADLEAGLNDALAFPFTNAAIAMAVAGGSASGWLLEWLAIDVVYKLVSVWWAASWSASCSA